MEISTIAKQLKIPITTIQRESIRDFLERKLLETRTEILVLTKKYGIKNLKEFNRLIRKGKIHENPATREDFFRLDFLESRLQTIQRLIKSL